MKIFEKLKWKKINLGLPLLRKAFVKPVFYLFIDGHGVVQRSISGNTPVDLFFNKAPWLTFDECTRCSLCVVFPPMCKREIKKHGNCIWRERRNTPSVYTYTHSGRLSYIPSSPVSKKPLWHWKINVFIKFLWPFVAVKSGIRVPTRADSWEWLSQIQ